MNDIVATYWGLIPTAWILYQFIRGQMDDAKNSGNKDTEQDLRMQQIEGRIDRIQDRYDSIEKRIDSIDLNTSKELKKLEEKMDSGFRELNKLIITWMQTHPVNTPK